MSSGSVEGRNIGYYESWANTRKCSAVSPEDLNLNLNGFTHLNFAFVFFDPNTFDIVPMDKNAGDLLHRFTKLKEKKSGLQTWVSVGGWSFNDRKSRNFLLLPVYLGRILLTLRSRQPGHINKHLATWPARRQTVNSSSRT
jgi:GH18 family chitinase